MPLATCKNMVLAAHKGGYAIAAMNSNGGNYDIMRACLEAAEELKSPMIINVYAKNARYAGLGYVAHSAKHLIEQFAPTIPVAIHLDHGQAFADCVVTQDRKQDGSLLMVRPDSRQCLEELPARAPVLDRLRRDCRKRAARGKR